MSSPITIHYPTSRAYEHSEHSSSPSSPGVYIPIHRRARLSGSSSAGQLQLGTLSSSYTSSSSRSVSPTPSSMRSISPAPPSTSHPSLPIYAPADLIRLAASPLSKLSPEMKEALRTAAPEVLQSRKERKAQEWRARHSQGQAGAGAASHKRMSSHASSHSSESGEERMVNWRRV